MERLEQLKKEAIKWGGAALVVYAIALLSFNEQQKKWIDERDKGQCQGNAAGLKHRCKGRLERHHIIPQGYAKRIGLDPDFGENGILLCQAAHRLIHPDLDETLRNYHQNKKDGINGFDKLREQRNALLDEREIYWNSKWDRQLIAYATRATQKMRRRGKPFPLNRKQKKEYGQN